MAFEWVYLLIRFHIPHFQCGILWSTQQKIVICTFMLWGCHKVTHRFMSRVLLISIPMVWVTLVDVSTLGTADNIPVIRSEVHTLNIIINSSEYLYHLWGEGFTYKFWRCFTYFPCQYSLPFICCTYHFILTNFGTKKLWIVDSIEFEIIVHYTERMLKPISSPNRDLSIRLRRKEGEGNDESFE